LALFSPAAFVGDTKAGRCRLDAVRESALSAQSELEGNLRQRVFTIVEILANGFANQPGNGISDTEDGRRLLYENSLIFLYRLLFVLYAEGRLLLPVEPKSQRYYRDLSLSRLLGPLRHFSEYDNDFRTHLCGEIRELFNLINGVNRDKNRYYVVPQYNGGLFSPEKYPCLEKWTISDARLAEVLRGLMFARPHKDGSELPLEAVDYADLRVQQLGSIYEGLLEHKFVRDAAGRFVLQNDKGERKATGTYYTPDYVVKYIVEQVTLPLLEEIEARDAVRTAIAAGKKDNSFAEAVLTLNLCDPAMGSGHFLVAATVYLAEKIAEHPTTKPQAGYKRGASQEKAEIAYWRRRVVEACIYGVDLNPLAVELAKLSLWLTTISSDQPLNFLDHHLRHGNSLIGARLAQLGSLPQKKDLGDATQLRFGFGPDFMRAVAGTIRHIQKIEAEASGDMEAVKDKEKRWRNRILPRLEPYREVADLWTDTFFGHPLTEDEYLGKVREILPQVVHADTDGMELGEAAARYGKRPRGSYFHWELEFPDVFFNGDGTPKTNPGFDAVVSNPPWGMLQPHNTAPAMLDCLRLLFTCSDFKMDMFQLFMEQGLRLVANDHYLGMIVPNTLLTNTYCKRIRGLFQRQTTIRNLLATTETIFPEAEVHPAILVTEKKPPAQNDISVLVHETTEPFEAVLARRKYASLPQSDMAAFDGNSWNIRLSASLACIVRMAATCSTPLREWASVKRGLITGNRKEFFSPECKGLKWRPIITGTDVQRYALHPPAEYVLFEKPGRTAGGCWDEDVHRKKGKILLKQVGRWPQAAVDEGPCCITGNVFAVILKSPDVSPYYLAAILNSRFTRELWTVILSDFKAVFPELKGDWIEQWPIRRIAFTTPKKKRAALLDEGMVLYRRDVEDTDDGGNRVLAFVVEQLAVKPERADVVHDLLAALATEMVRLNGEKSAAAKTFLADLRDFHGVDTRALTPKTRLDEFWKLETSEVFMHLRRNANALAERGIRLTTADEEKIRNRFQTATPGILALEPRLAFTDRLIDRMVNRLYGLNDDEVVAPNPSD
jgi:hypothetical protein